jgi:NADH-quinone oxidoreductase subunit J
MTVLFILFGLMAVLGAVLLVSRKMPISGAMSLLLVLISISCMYVLLDAPFLAMIQLIVYAGAILILIVYVIMLLNLREPTSAFDKFFKSPQKIVALLVGVGLLVLLTVGMIKTSISAPSSFEAVGTVENIGTLLVTTHLLPFEVVSILLLVAILGAVLIAKRDKSDDEKGSKEEDQA